MSLQRVIGFQQTAGEKNTLKNGALSDNNKILVEDSPVHDWYRFVLAFPPHLVRHYLEKFEIGHDHRVLDPFCGTGTTLVECKKNGIPSAGVEANPVVYFAAKVKTDWTPDPKSLKEHAAAIADLALMQLKQDGINDSPITQGSPIASRNLKSLTSEKMKLLLKDSISPLPMHKALVLMDSIEKKWDKRFFKHELLALAQVLVHSASNLRFGPEVGLGLIKKDAAVIQPWLSVIMAIANDLLEINRQSDVDSLVLQADSRQISSLFKLNEFDAVITSPPYPNEKDYTRTTRLESVFLGFIKSKSDLRKFKMQLIRSNTRGVYKSDDDDGLISDNNSINKIAEKIEERRISLGKTSGFERLYSRVAKLYFGGMARHFSQLRGILKPGARLAYVVGDQASYLRVMIKTGEILAQIAASLGYNVMDIDLFRTRISTATKSLLREEVLVLEWPG
jgi:hypothetical protein